MSKGWISQIESERLHSIRFLGNDAAHKIVRPTEESLEAALIIVEHLLNTIYILDKESKGKLKERIDKYEDFEGLLLEKIDNYGDGDIVCLKEILGRETNLLKGSIKSFEEILRANIGKKQFKRLGFSDFKGAKEKQDLQHYKVISPHPPN